MKMVREEITVVADGGAREVVVVLGGYRITFSEDEARLVAGEIGAALATLDRPRAPVAAPPAQPIISAAQESPEGDVVLDGLRRLSETRRDGLRAR
jgi:hypothetical protein